MVAHGQDITKSYLASLNSLTEEIKTQNDLIASQQEYFELRREKLNSTNNPWSTLYTFDENGQQKYRDGVFEAFSYMLGTDENYQPNMNAVEQYNYITSESGLGISDAMLVYDASGKEIKFTNDDGTTNYSAYETAVQAFWDKIESDKNEMQSLHDSIQEHKNAVLNEAQKRNEILKAIEDNQISVENRVYNAIVDMRQRTIDAL